MRRLTPLQCLETEYRIDTIFDFLNFFSPHPHHPSMSSPPAAKRSARRRWACTPTSRAWYVGVSGGLGWCPGKTSGRSASSARPPSAPLTRWDRQRPPPTTHTRSLGSGRGRGCPTAARPTSHAHTDHHHPLTPACVAFLSLLKHYYSACKPF